MVTATAWGVMRIRPLRAAVWFLLATVVTIAGTAGEASAVPAPPAVLAQPGSGGGIAGEANHVAKPNEAAAKGSGAARPQETVRQEEVAPPAPGRHVRPTTPEAEGPAPTARLDAEAARPEPGTGARPIVVEAVAPPGASKAPQAPTPDRDDRVPTRAQPSDSGLAPGADKVDATSTDGPSATTPPAGRADGAPLSLGSGSPHPSPRGPSSPRPPGSVVAGPRLQLPAPADALLGISLTRQLPARPGADSVVDRTTVADGFPAAATPQEEGGIDGWRRSSNGSPGSVAITTGAPSRSSGRAASPNQVEPGPAIASVVALVLLIQAAVLVARRNAAPSRRRLVAVAAGGQVRCNTVMGAVSGAGPPGTPQRTIRSVSIDPSAVARIDAPTTTRTITTTSTTSLRVVASDATAEPFELSRGTETGSNSSFGFHLLSAVAHRERALLPRPGDRLRSFAAWPDRGDTWPPVPVGAAPGEPGRSARREHAPPLSRNSRVPLCCRGRDPPGDEHDETVQPSNEEQRRAPQQRRCRKIEQHVRRTAKEKHDQCTSHRRR
ncbi:MAG: hypothetical protein M3N15_07245 [Actinomycetota bacterium]|nr:hypothetical protein [Actinomycetota bacterium]